MRDNKKDIIIELLESGGENPTIRQLSQKTGIRYTNVYSIVKKLAGEDLINLEKVGNSFQCSLNKQVHPLIFSAEFERKKTLNQGSDFKVLYKRLNSLKFSFIALIFGSYAKGTASNSSDIDLMVIGDESREKEINSVLSVLPLKIHLLFFTNDEFLKMAQSKEFSVVGEAIQNNIILIGIEDYYRLMEDG
jgi:predicted nucleotidyltransferase